MWRKLVWIAGGVVGVIVLLSGLSMFEGAMPFAPSPLDVNTMQAPSIAPGALGRNGGPLVAPPPVSDAIQSEAGAAAGKAVAPALRAAAPAPPATGTGTADAAGGWSAFQFDQKIVRNAVLTIVAKDVNQAIDQVADIVAANTGAFIASSNIFQKDDKTQATIVLKVPAADFDQTMRRVRQIGDKVTSENTSTQDVTEEYVDLESQQRNLKATQEKYLQLLAKAVSIQDILSIQERLNNVQSQIDRTEGRLRFLQQRTSLSTITLNLTPVAPATTGRPGAPWDPAKTFAIALANLLRATQGLLDGAIYLAIYALPLVPVAALVWWLLRRKGPTSLLPQTPK